MPTSPAPTPTAAVVGGGPAGLMAAEVLAGAGVAVTVHERMPSPARKLLLAGHGGLNLTHSEPLDAFLGRYGAAAEQIAPALAEFGPEDLRTWCAGLGEPTFVGTSGRVFPAAFRATPLVRAWLTRLEALGVRVERRRRWTGWSADGALVLESVDGERREERPDVTVLALGGASWPRLGADGSWVDVLAGRGVAVTPLRPANVGMRVAWTAGFAEAFAGVPLKNVALRVRRGEGVGTAGRDGGTDRDTPGRDGGTDRDAPGRDARPAGPGTRAVVRGDAMVTATGLEGGPVYALGAAIRAELDAHGRCVLEVDLRPDLDAARLTERLARRRPKDSGATWLRRTLGLDRVAVALLREAVGAALPVDPAQTAALVKAVPVVVTGTMPIDRAISTAGGVAWSEVDDALMLRAVPGTFVAGEMLDWEAPTGGYLLQASFATGVLAARGALAWLAR